MVALAIGFWLERREAMKDACEGWESVGGFCSAAWAREEEANARVAVDEMRCGCRSWRRSCWRIVRMHDVQAVDVDIVCGSPEVCKRC